MRSSISHFDQRIRRNRVLSWWDAESAVHHDVSLDDFLIHRLYDYEAQGRHSPLPLPVDVGIEQGKPIRIPNPEYDPFWQQIRDDPTGEDAAEFFQIQSENQEIARTLEEIEDELAQLTHLRQEISQQQEAREAEQVGPMPTSVTQGAK